jgi:hypothetical protein
MQSPTIIYRIYKHTSISGKAYIGYTYKSMIERYGEERKHSRNKNHKWKIDKALRKYPNENQWTHDVLIDDIPTLEEANKIEIEMIAFYDTYKNGYNSTPGGGGHGPNSKETKNNISKAKKGRSNGLEGTHKSEETKKKMSEALKGKYIGRIPWNKGLKLGPQSEEVRRKTSESLKGRPSPMKGKFHTEEWKIKQSKDWIFIDPNGIKIEIHNLNKYCKEHNLLHASMRSLIFGRSKQHRGYKQYIPV